MHTPPQRPSRLHLYLGPQWCLGGSRIYCRDWVVFEISGVVVCVRARVCMWVGRGEPTWMAVEKAKQREKACLIVSRGSMPRVSWKGGWLELDRQLFQVPFRIPPPFGSCVITHPYDFLNAILVWWEYSVGF